MAHMVENMFYVKMDERDVPWHGLGTPVSSAPVSSEAIKLAGLDWKVLQEPVYTKDGIKVPNAIVNVRETDRSILGVVTSRYKVLQNEDAFSVTDYIVKNSFNTKAVYDTAGSLKGGRRIWLSVKLESRKILGDDVIPYLMFTNSHDGKGSVKVAITPIRVVCNNTLIASLNGAKRVWSIKHMGDVKGKMEEADSILFDAINYIRELSTFASNLYDIKLSDDKVSFLLEKLYPLPEDEDLSDLTKNRIIAFRDSVRGIYMEKDDLQEFKGTGWGFYNAVADFESHYIPFRNTQTFQEKRIERFIDGGSRIEKAQELLLAS